MDGSHATSTDRAAAWVGAADRIAVLTGAGISTESGIPDFRGPNGLWTTRPESMRLMNIEDYLRDPSVRADAWKERMRHPAWEARPNDGHRALVSLERRGALLALMTQNVDGLHQAAGSSHVLELHGTMHRAKCLSCDRRTPMREQLDRVRAGDPDPACTACGGIQKSATVAFGEQLDPDVLEAAFAASRTSDLFLAIGTSLVVQPAALLALEAHRHGARLVIVNQGETPFDQVADAMIREPIGEVLPLIVGDGEPGQAVVSSSSP
ncbi:MAG TPA: NAD-dependent deacylase [Actinomycetota bacterium]|nr:NAD-dependent deacylase [Actinomycetota bacterium]